MLPRSVPLKVPLKVPLSDTPASPLPWLPTDPANDPTRRNEPPPPRPSSIDGVPLARALASPSTSVPSVRFGATVRCVPKAAQHTACGRRSAMRSRVPRFDVGISSSSLPNGASTNAEAIGLSGAPWNMPVAMGVMPPSSPSPPPPPGRGSANAAASSYVMSLCVSTSFVMASSALPEEYSRDATSSVSTSYTARTHTGRGDGSSFVGVRLNKRKKAAMRLTTCRTLTCDVYC
mmetsp:Transcript_37902/g.117115  ORF Transcript_37902/g.117115 Transcript_37902/m.117115 type:complete len:233 (+) Transcript_37902:348-1046(+)